MALNSEHLAALPAVLSQGLCPWAEPARRPTRALSACLMPAGLAHREYCQRVLRKPTQHCSAYTLSFDTTVFIIESTRRRVAVEATLGNRGENAYSAVLNISQSPNLQFASLVQRVSTSHMPRQAEVCPPFHSC